MQKRGGTYLLPSVDVPFVGGSASLGTQRAPGVVVGNQLQLLGSGKCEANLICHQEAIPGDISVRIFIALMYATLNSMLKLPDAATMYIKHACELGLVD